MRERDEPFEPDDGAPRLRAVELRELAQARPPGWELACVEAALEDPHPYVRSVAARSLAGAGPAQVVGAAAAALGAPEPAVRFRALRLLVRQEPRAAAAALEAEAAQVDPRRRTAAIDALGRLGAEALDALCRRASSPEVATRARVARALGAMGIAAAAAPLAALAQDPVPRVRLAAYRALGRLGDRPGAGPALGGLGPLLEARLAEEVEPELCRELARAAVRAGATLPTAAAAAAAREEDAALSSAALVALGRAGAATALLELCGSGEQRLARAAAFEAAACSVEAALALFESPDAAVRLAAVRGLGAAPESPRGRAALDVALDDEDDGVRWLARRALAGLVSRQVRARHEERPPAAGPSATWPFGLPLPAGADPAARRPLAVAAVNLSYNLNLGVLVRSAEAAGARHFFVVGHEVHHVGAAMGAEAWVDLRVLPTHEAFVAEARGLGYQLVAVQQSPGAERFDRAEYPPRPCLVLGSEGQGLPPRLCAAADLVVEIPIRGAIDSLNVASAGAVVLWTCLSRLGWLEP